MAVIVKGTTPTITYTFETVQLSDIHEAILSIKGRAGTLAKDISTAEAGTKSLSWTLTQEETLAMSNYVSMMLNFVLNDGTRGASAQSKILVESNHINEVI